MDTQGLFDHKTSKQDAAMIGCVPIMAGFLLSWLDSTGFLLSSLQFFNVKGQIESNHLEHIYVITNFAVVIV